MKHWLFCKDYRSYKSTKRVNETLKVTESFVRDLAPAPRWYYIRYP